MNLKFRVIRWFLTLKKKHSKISIREEKIIRIVKTLLRDQTTDLYYAPINGTRYIKTNDDSIFVIMYNESVIISNHQYFYDISISQDASEELSILFDRVTEMRRRKMEKEMLKNVSASLDKIASDLDEKEKLSKNYE